ALEERLAEIERLDEPLPARHDLEWPVSLLVKLHRVDNRPRLPDQIAARLELLDDLDARLRGGQIRQLVVRLLGPRGVVRFPPFAAPDDRLQCAVWLNDGADRQREGAP